MSNNCIGVHLTACAVPPPPLTLIVFPIASNLIFACTSKCTFLSPPPLGGEGGVFTGKPGPRPASSKMGRPAPA